MFSVSPWPGRRMWWRLRQKGNLGYNSVSHYIHRIYTMYCMITWKQFDHANIPTSLWSTEHWKKAHSQSHPGLLNTFFICQDEEDLAKVRIIYHFLSGSVASPFMYVVMAHGAKITKFARWWTFRPLLHAHAVSPQLLGGISVVGTSSDLNCSQIQISLAPIKI